MSEPSSAASAASAMAGVGLAMYLPGIDGNALLGGFGGAIFFVVFARDYNALTRSATCWCPGSAAITPESRRSAAD